MSSLHAVQQQRPVTVSILEEYIAALAELDATASVALNDPAAINSKRQELCRTCLLRLNQARTKGIVGLLEQAVRVLGDSHHLEASPESVEAAVASSSQPLAELLRLQLVSQNEEGLYELCRVAWDHAHVGDRVVALLAEVGKREWEEAFGTRAAGVRHGLRVVGMSSDDDEGGDGDGDGDGDGEDGRKGGETEGLDDRAYVGALERDVVENLEGLVGMMTAHRRGGGNDTNAAATATATEGSSHDKHWEAVEELEARARNVIVEQIVTSVVFEKGGLPKPSRAARLRGLLRAGSALDAMDAMESAGRGTARASIVEEAGRRLAELVFAQSVRRVLVTFGDVAKHPVGYREKVVLKVLTCLKNDTLFGHEDWVAAVGQVLWGLVAGWYVAEWDGDDGQHGACDEATVMRRMAFAKKLEAKVEALFGTSVVGAGTSAGTLAAAASVRAEEILRRLRADAMCAVRDALFGVGVDSGVDSVGGSYRVIASGDPLISWGRETHEAAGADTTNTDDDGRIRTEQRIMGVDVLSELQSTDADTPLCRAEMPLVVRASHVAAMGRLAAALQENAALLSDGQYAHFVGSLAEDVAALLTVLVELRGDDGNSDTILRLAALEYMSCMYVARSLCALRFGDKKSGVRSIATPAPAFDAACRRIAALGARDVLGRRLDAFRRAHLVEHLEVLTAWRQRVDVQDIISKKKAVSRLTHAFGRLEKSLTSDAATTTAPAVPPAFVAAIVTDLLDWVADVVVDSILDLPDISEELSEALVQVLDEVPEGLWAAAGGPIRADIRDIPDIPDIPGDMSTPLMRLKALCDIMSMTSAEIVTGFLDGILGGLFDRHEVVTLVGALFEPTDQVRANLDRLVVV